MKPCALTSCHVVICKQGSKIWAVGYNMCVTGRRSCDEHHAVRFGQSAENRSRAWDTQPIRGVSDELARGFKRWYPLASGKKYGKKPSLWVYISTSISQLTTNWGSFSRIKWEIYFLKMCFIEVCKSCVRLQRLELTFIAITHWSILMQNDITC